jgi:hypothetical protein
MLVRCLFIDEHSCGAEIRISKHEIRNKFEAQNPKPRPSGEIVVIGEAIVPAAGVWNI